MVRFIYKREGFQVTTEIRQALYESGISLSLVHEIMALMEPKPLRVQRAFLLRLQGMTQQEIADVLEVDQATVSRMFDAMIDVCGVLRENCVLLL